MLNHVGFIEVLGLEQNLAPEEFESRLGRFLHEVQAFKAIGRLAEISVKFPHIPEQAKSLNLLKDWHQQTNHQLDQITDVLNDSLYDSFANGAYDVAAANRAYAGLLNVLGITPQHHMVCATTNYDPILEVALRESGWRTYWGEPPSAGVGSDSKLDVSGMLDTMPGFTPVLHLHGRVGWYRRDGDVYCARTSKHSKEYGVPVVMYPDLKKSYEDDPVIATMWSQFEQALQRAKRVFVLGHSLHDPKLVATIATSLDDFERLAVSTYAPPEQTAVAREAASYVEKVVSEQLGNARRIPMVFGTDPQAGHEMISAWLGQTRPKFG
jgi:hypothetical protein